MPAKGSSLKNGPRFGLVGKKLWRRFMEETGVEIKYSDFVNIINTSNESIATKVANNISGFKLPAGLGYMAITRYKPKPDKDGKQRRYIDFNGSKKAGCTVYHTNFHSFGYKPRLLWLTDQLSNCKYINIYKMLGCREFTRDVSHKMQAGKIYNEFNYEHFKTRRIRVKNLADNGI
jgi:hypothetical protein